MSENHKANSRFSEDESMDEFIPPEFIKVEVEEEEEEENEEDEEEEEDVEEVINNLLPAKSKLKYEAAYKKFNEWRAMKKIKNVSETILVSYFSDLAENHKPSSLWVTYAMLRSVIQLEHNINISNYLNLIAFLKHSRKGYKGKEAEVLSSEQINQFLHEAPDDKFLATKVAIIFEVQGGCKRLELCNLTVDDIKDKGDMILVQIPKTKNDKSKSFVVTDDFYHIYKKYAILRPNNVSTTRFFLSYKDGKCLQRGIGINSFGSIPKTVARYLKLDDPDNYARHTFRKTSANLLADFGADLLTVKSEPSSTTSNILPKTNSSTHTTMQSPIDIHIEEKDNIDIETLNKVASDSSKNIHFHFSNCPNISIYINGKKMINDKN